MKPPTTSAVALALFLLLPSLVSTQAPGPHVIDLALGEQDFLVTTRTLRPPPIIQLSDHSQALASGDLNGDGVADLVLGAAAFIDVPPIAGEVFVVFGPGAAGGSADLGNLGAGGARLTGADPGDMFGWSVAVADMNGDSQDDLIVGALRGDGLANTRADAGDAYIFLGPIAAGALISAANADVTVHGIDPADFLGFSLGAGDVSGDGIADLVLGARDADGFANMFAATPTNRAGEAHVLFGPLNAGTIDLAVTPADVAVFGATADYMLGNSVTAGDVTGDNVADLVMGAPRSAVGGPSRGQTHVLFGPLAAGTVVNLGTTPADVSIAGQINNDQMGMSVVVADVTGDGIGDLVTSARLAAMRIPGATNFNQATGAAYAFFGPLAAGTHVLASAGNATIYLPASGSGQLASMAAGDLNADGTADLVLGAKFGAGLLPPPPPGTTTLPGEAFAVFGPFSTGTVIDLTVASPDIMVAGPRYAGRLGTSVAVADVNDDGGGDLIAQASGINLTSIAHGEAYVVFGTSPFKPPATVVLAPVTATTIAGMEHCVVAAVDDEAGDPVPDITVRFSVTGANSAGSMSMTNIDGQASFCYIGTTAGEDIVSAFADTDDNGLQNDEPGDAAGNTYVPGVPASLTLAPPTATVTVDSQHCVIATAVDQFANPTPGTTVRFSATGITTSAGAPATDGNGAATFCHGSTLPGEVSIQAYADADNDNAQDAGEPIASATTTWVMPELAPGCGTVIGAGAIVVNGRHAIFAMTVRKRAAAGVPAGIVTYAYARGRRFKSAAITQMAIVGNEVTIHGIGRDTNGPLVPFRIDASAGRPEAFRIAWPGYAAEGPVERVGGILILRSRCKGGS